MAIIDAPSPALLTTPMTDTLKPSNQLWVEEPQTTVLEEDGDAEQENLSYAPLVEYINSRFTRSKTRRWQDEQRWLAAYRNYRGIYGPDVQFTSTEKSRVFIKITKTKVLASYAQVIDVLFAGNKFPIGIEPGKPIDPEQPDTIHIESKPSPAASPAPASAVRPEFLGPLRKLLEPVLGQVKEGPGLTPTSATFEPLKVSAKKMQDTILDQLAETDAAMHLRNFAFELCLLGTGIIKGPFAYDKEYPNWSSEGVYTPVRKTIPKSSYVSIWNAYPDADAKNMKECDYFIERHKMSRSQLRDLKRRTSFRKDSIDLAILYGPNYTPEYWENMLEDNRTSVSNESFEVLEYWGVIDKDTAIMSELDLPEEFDDVDEVAINAWICNGQILRLILNPFTPRRIPYHACPYELNPYSFFGIGVAENMADTQLLMNGFMRMAVDNAALSGNVILEVNETLLTPGQSMEVYPGKIFKTQGPVGQSIHSTKFDNTTQENLALYDKARQLADEATSMPSYAHGGTGINQVGRTAAGMQMLMGAADKITKAVVRNIDDYLLSPWGNDHYSFNQQFNFNPEFNGLKVIARGTESLLKNEVHGQKLQQFMQIVMGNPATAPYGKIDYLLRETAESLDLDPEKAVNDPREAMIQALILSKMAPQGSPAQPDNGAANGSTAPQPGMPGYSGTGGGANGGDTTGGQPPQQQPQQQGGATA